MKQNSVSRRQFLVGSFLAPLAVPVAADFTRNSPPLKAGSADVESVGFALESLALKAIKIPLLPVFSVLTMLNSAIARGEDKEFAEYVVKFDFAEQRETGGAK